MSAVVTSTVGTVDWLDLSTQDVHASLAFYREVFGWEFDRSEAQLGVYYTGRLGGQDAVGLMQRGAEVPSFVPATWSIYIRVEQADAAAARATLVGGTVVHDAFDLPGGARMAIVSDPTGAQFVIVSGPEGLGMVRDAPGAFVGCEILTRDVDRAKHFYHDMFGWDCTVDLESGYITMHLEGREVAGLMAMPPEVPADAPAHWLPYFAVTDCQESCDTIQRFGGSLAMPIRAMGVEDVSIKMAVAQDPQGAMFGLVETLH
jgi:predicted enzyme related to lactoylglutathione lyase